MRWTPVVFETATCGCLSLFGANARAERSDDHTICVRPKSRYPGASPCAMGQRQGSLLVQRVSGGVEVPWSGDPTAGSVTRGRREASR